MVKIIGGDRMKAYLDGMAAKLSKANSVDVGFLGEATYPDGTNVATVAALNEFGVPSHNQPPRPFFRGMIVDKQGEWGPATAELLKANDYDAAKTLDGVGNAVASQLKNSIAAFDGPALAPSTVEKKGSEKQLIDTAHMLNSVDHRVNSGE